MAWYVYVAWFFAGVLLANAIPHIVHGMSGNRFQTPFASPPGIGDSSALINVIWGFVNLTIGGGGCSTTSFRRKCCPASLSAGGVRATGG
jgi:hypothetical protein